MQHHLHECLLIETAAAAAQPEKAISGITESTFWVAQANVEKSRSNRLAKCWAINFMIRKHPKCVECLSLLLQKRSNSRRILINEILYAKCFILSILCLPFSKQFFFISFTIQQKARYVVVLNLLFANESRELSVQSLRWQTALQTQQQTLSPEQLSNA